MEALKILLTGGTGLIGTRLTEILLNKGYRVCHLVRFPKQSQVEACRWDPQTKYIDRNALAGVDIVIHLAGLDVSQKRWNAGVKNEILESRAGTARFLREFLENQPERPRAFISASGVNYYGVSNVGRHYDESDKAGRDFMSRVTVLWEQEAEAFSQLGMRTAAIRTGMVLSAEGGALKKLALPVRFCVGSPLGSGQQMVSWIHIDDLCAIYLRAIEDEQFRGPYNAVAPYPVTNEAFINELARVLKKPLWAPNVPEFVVRLVAGEVADIVLEGAAVAPRRLLDVGFSFQYPTLPGALENLYPAKP